MDFENDDSYLAADFKKENLYNKIIINVHP